MQVNFFRELNLNLTKNTAYNVIEANLQYM